MPDTTERDEVMPVVSVCVITYNQAPYVEKCLDSILAQRTDFPIEICVGEDDSSDGTREICRRYADNHPEKVRLFLRERKDVIYHGGQPTGNFNLLQTLKECRGDYIALCEGDDYWLDPLKLQRQVDFLEAHPDFSGVCTQVEVIDRDGTPLGPSQAFPKRDTLEFDYLIGAFAVYTCSFMLRRGAIDERFLEWLKHTPVGDIPLFVWCSRSGPIGCMPDKMAAYRQGVGVWSKQGRTATAKLYLGLCDHFETEMKTPEEKAALNAARTLNRMDLIQAYADIGKPLTALCHVPALLVCLAKPRASTFDDLPAYHGTHTLRYTLYRLAVGLAKPVVGLLPRRLQTRLFKRFGGNAHRKDTAEEDHKETGM